MNRHWKIRNTGLACGLLLVGLGGCSRNSEQTKPRPTLPTPTDIWTSETTGKEYRVRIENEVFHAEWVNIPPNLAQREAYIRTECRRVGTKWIGTSQSYLPCAVGQGVEEHIANWCHVVTRIEFDAATADRIVGRGEALHRFDCQRCKILETVWKDFVWVPKR